ncbi:MAG: RDD family protein [Treponema sp.]|nr:RDD family protein [Treponema sp.]
MNSKRIEAFFIDFIIITLIYEIPFFLLVMLPIIQGKAPAANFTMKRSILCTFFAYILLVFKDVFRNGSLGKKIMKLKIIDSKTNKNASVGKRILRNITWILSWIEFIVYLTTNKRIGDRLAKTDVVQIS